MAENSKIEWTDHTFNHVRGCSKVSPGCAHCYAETMSGRNPGTLGVWGPNGTRVVASESYWRLPLKWDREAKSAGERRRVFCASLADVFEDWQGDMQLSNGDIAGREVAGGGMMKATMDDVRARLFALIDQTPNLDWLLLTKRPENIARMMPAYFPGGYIAEAGAMNQQGPRPNVWLGVSCEDQQRANERILVLLKTPAAVRFLSCEPLLGPVDLEPFLWLSGPSTAGPWTDCLSRRRGGGGIGGAMISRKSAGDIHWVIVGGESGPGARPCDVAWIRSIVWQCKAAGVACFVKQMGSDPVSLLSLPLVRPDGFRLKDKKGGDIEEWPADLKVREFPTPATARG